MNKAVVFGASGMVGHYILSDLLEDNRYSEVLVVVRKPLTIQHPKLTTIIADLSNLSEALKGQQVDQAFIAIGTTKKKTPDEADYYKIDHDYPVLAAKISKEAGAKSVMLVSAIGANENSSVFYNRTKGQTEKDVLALGFDHSIIVRPSLIMGHRKENRPAERMAQGLWKIINPLFLGGWSKYKGIQAPQIAKALIREANQNTKKSNILYYNEMVG